MRKGEIIKLLQWVDASVVLQFWPLEDIYGPTLDEDFNLLILTKETRGSGEIIN